MRLRPILAVALLAPALTACFIEVTEESKDGTQGGFGEHDPHDMPAQVDGKAQWCEARLRAGDPSAPRYCFEDDAFRWRTSCQRESCQELSVFLHYMLPEDLGDGRIAHVEAFDNAYFQGSPRGTVRIGEFRARTGSWEKATLFLEPGEYYLRAYLATDEAAPTPYQLGGMQLVAGEPVGVFGALSGAQQVRVAPRHVEPFPSPVHIKLDKLLQKPGAAVDTKAYLRVDLSTPEDAEIPDRRAVVIGLYADDDLEAEPLHRFRMSSAELLVQGRVGRADFVTPSLPEGRYVVFAYLDANGNDRYDDGELSQVHTERQRIAAVDVRKNRTARVTLALAGADVPELPAE